MPTGLGSRPTFSCSHPRSSRYIWLARQWKIVNPSRSGSGTPSRGRSVYSRGQLEPPVFLAALLIFVGIPALTVLKLARLRASRPQSASADVTERLEAVEHRVEDLQQELAETQERLDFAERLLSKARD